MSSLPDLDRMPDAGFARRLEDLLHADMGWDTTGPAPRSRAAARRRRRPRLVAVVATALAVAAASVALVALAMRQQPTTPPPATVPETTVAVSTPPTTSLTPTTSLVPTTTPTATTVPPRPAYGNIDAGTYSIDTFIVPFRITTSVQWFRSQSTEQNFVLQGGGGSTALVVSSSEAAEQPSDVVEQLCAGSIDWAPSEATTLMGGAAIRNTGTVTAACEVVACANVVLPNPDGTGAPVPPGCVFGLVPGDVVEVTAADIDGRVISVTLGASTAVTPWPDVVDMLRATVDSITRSP